MRPGISAATALGLFMVAGAPARAVTEDQFRLRNTGDLAALCSAPATDPLYTAAINFCHGFGAGAYSILAEAQNSDPSLRWFCLPPGVTRNEAIAAFVTWTGADPARTSMPAPDGITAFLSQSYPCTGATTGAAPRRTR